MHALRNREHALADEMPLAVLDCVFSPSWTLRRAIDDLCARAIDLVRGGAAILLLTDRPQTNSGFNSQQNCHPDRSDPKGSAVEGPAFSTPATNGHSKHSDPSDQQLTDPQQNGHPDRSDPKGSAVEGPAFSTLLTIPMALATGAVHHALVNAGVRTHAGLAVEAGDCRDLHHAAVLFGFGAGAVCPWLALETARSIDAERGEANMLHAFDLGLAKIMSKMGISVIDSYRGAHLFDILGLDNEVVQLCFYGTPSPISGIGFHELEAALRDQWAAAHDEEPALVNVAAQQSQPTVTAQQPAQAKTLPDYGWVRFRKDERAEPHSWQPQTVKALQTVTGTARGAAAALVQPAQAWTAFGALAVEAKPTVLRDLLEIRPAAAPLTLDQVETAPTIVARFVSSAMSLGSLSPEAHQTITEAMNLLGGRSNTGEGGEDPAVYPAYPGAPAILNNKVKQVASARFGVTTEYLANAEEIEIKISQGSKPGEGGQLPGHKVTELIARLRHAQPGVTLISPPPHHDIYSIEDLAQLIFDLKRVNPRAAIGVKLVSGCGVGTVAAGVAKAYADYIVIAGHSGGTGASPLSSIKYAGNPWELGLAEAQQVLMQNGLRGRVRLRCDGGLRTGRDVLIAALLGADEFAFGTSVLVALGCDMARQCHLNTCPTGIATQRPELRAKFRGKPENVVRLFEELTRDLQMLLARLGLPSLEAATGRVDLLEQVSHAGGLDLRALLAPGPKHAQPGGQLNHIRWQGQRNRRPTDHAAIDNAWVQPALAARAADQPFSIQATIANEHRTLGARLAGELVWHGLHEKQTPLDFHLTGVAGQSFGAFAIPGMSLKLDGMANDFVGKGLCGGELILRGQGRAARESELHVILGNVALYGATSGSLFAAGRAGERFAVRNSGALAVVEGIGDHGCEYMTGGTVVVLGSTGQNFGAGMTGGLAYVFDEDGAFLNQTRYHTMFLSPEPVAQLDEAAVEPLRRLIELHAHKTKSTRAAWILSDWQEKSKHFLRLTPKPQA